MKNLLAAMVLSFALTNAMAGTEVITETIDASVETRIANLEMKVARLEVNENRERPFCICKPGNWNSYTLIRIIGNNERNLGEFADFNRCNQMAMNCR